MSSLLIIGAGGFAKELLETVVQADIARDIYFYDDVSAETNDKFLGEYPVIRSLAEAKKLFTEIGSSFVVGVGSSELREEFTRRFTELGGEPETIISPFAKIGTHRNQIGVGTCILTDAIIESSNVIGEGVLIHVGVIVSHDVEIGDYCEISPRANLLGGVKIGKRCRIGTNATILPRVSIADDVIVGAGAVVTADVESGRTVVGVPAKMTK